MGMIEKKFDRGRKLTDEELKLLEALQDKEPVPDEDCPELTDAQLDEVIALAKAKRNKQVVSVRLSPKAIETAKSLGKGYTSVLSQILENALQDAETVKKYL